MLGWAQNKKCGPAEMGVPITTGSSFNPVNSVETLHECTELLRARCGAPRSDPDGGLETNLLTQVTQILSKEKEGSIDESSPVGHTVPKRV